MGGIHFGRIVNLPNPDIWRPGGLAGTLGERVVNDAEIVGVIPDVKQGSLMAPVQPAVYVPHEQWTMRRMAVVVRADIDDPASLIPAIRSELAQMDSTIPAVFASTRMSSRRPRHGKGSERFAGRVRSGLAGARRRRNLRPRGVCGEPAAQRDRGTSRDGRRPREVLEMFLGRGLRLAGWASPPALRGAMALGQAIASQLYEVSALDPQVFVLVPLTMLAVTVLASYLPARKASRIDLSAALREN